MEVLTQQQWEKFWEDGYLRFGRVIDDAQVETLRAALARVIAEELEREDFSGLPPESAYGHARKGQAENGKPRAIHQFVNMWKVVPEYRQVLDNPRITGAVRDLMGVERVDSGTPGDLKPPGENAKFAFHHDFYFWPMDHPRLISCWLALDDATPANGCMHVVPGSHRPSLPAAHLRADRGASPLARVTRPGRGGESLR